MALVLTWLVSILSASRPAIELPRYRTRSTKDLRRSRLPERLILHLVLHSAPIGKRNFLLPPWLVALQMRLILYVVWTTMANLMRSHRTKSRRLPQAYFVTNYIHRILLDQSPYGPPRFQDRSAVIKLRTSFHHMKLVSRASRPGLTVGFLRILCNGLSTAHRFHTEGDEQTCRVGCPNEPDALSLSLTNAPLLCRMFLFGTCYSTTTEKPSSP